MDEACPSVAHVLDTEEYAGRESVVERLAAAQRAAGHDARVIAVVEEDAADPPFLEAARAAGFPLEVVRLPPRAYLEERRRLSELLREHRVDVMHSHGYRPDVVAGSAARRSGIARVSTVHGLVGGGWKNRVYERLQRWSLRRFDAVVGVSEDVASELVRDGVPRDRVHLVRNAWDDRDDFLSPEEARERLGVDRERFLIGWVGRLSHEKGPDVLLSALARSRMSDLSVSIIGDGPERESLRRTTEELPAGTDVRWHGAIPGAYRLYRAFDVFVLSSRTEGTPMVLLEAMAAGVPIVATAAGGVTEVVSPDEARIVPVEDPEALWKAVTEVRRMPGAAEDRARAAVDRLRTEFGMEQWVRRYRDVYLEAARSRSA